MAVLAGMFLLAALSSARAVDGGWCSKVEPGAAHPPLNLTPVTLQLIQGAIEPVPATDGLIHLAYAAQVTNVSPSPEQIVSVVPVNPIASFDPTGRNLVVNGLDQDITGKVQLFDTSLVDGAPPPPSPSGPVTIPAGQSGMMFFDVTYPVSGSSDVPALLSHALTVTSGGTSVTGLTDPTPVLCRAPVVLHPPLVGDGWWDGNGCCTIVYAHRTAILPINGTLKAPEQFAVDYVQIGPNGGCCDGPPDRLSSWPFFGRAPILAAAPGKIVDVVNDLPDQEPVGTIVNVTAANAAGNSVIEDIGDGRYIGYAHIKAGTIPASVRVGATLNTGDFIGDVGNSGSSTAPHLHFQVMDRPSFLDATGVPFVFDTQVVEGRVTEPTDTALDVYQSGGFLNVDRTGAGAQSDRMPAAGQVFGFGQP